MAHAAAATPNCIVLYNIDELLKQWASSGFTQKQQCTKCIVGSVPIYHDCFLRKLAWANFLKEGRSGSEFSAPKNLDLVLEKKSFTLV